MQDHLSGFQFSILIFTFPGIVQGVLLSLIVLFYPKNNKNSNSLLALFIISLTIVLLEPFLIMSFGWLFSGITLASRLIAIVVLYLYIKSLSEHITVKRKLKHLIAVPVYLLIFYSLMNPTFQLPFNAKQLAKPSFIELILMAVDEFYLLFYIYLFYKSYKIHKIKEQTYSAETGKLGSSFIKALIFSVIAVIIITYVIYFLMLSFPAQALIFCSVNFVMVSALIYWIMIFGKLNPQIYTLKKLEETKLKEQILAKISDSALLGEICKKVLSCLEKDKLYKTEGLSIKELAEKSGFQSYLVSQAINSVLNKTFFELVNEYRIEESKRLLTNPAYNHLSLVGIGFEAGFNSKTTFNSLFKKHTGFTPSEYKKNHSANTSQISRSTATSSFKI